MSTSVFTTFFRSVALLASALFPATPSAADEIDTRPLPIQVEVAFQHLNWAGWDNGEKTGVVKPLRPILVTHAGDRTNRLFVPTQQGVVYAFPNQDDAKNATVFLDIQSKVSYSDATNEEGFLGLAFHPEYRKNGRFFVYYTNRNEPHQNIVSSFRVHKHNPNLADAESEQILLVMNKPYWNHNGGTICFGPDGFLYIAVGDGGAANDPFGHGQKLSTVLGKILRIDVDRQDQNRPYAIPADNPLVGQKNVRTEIWAYGLRNVWRMAFDRKTGVLWAGDVGQNAWEEIDLIVKGGNYGWKLREGRHPLDPNRSESKPDFIEPIWEYSHDVGKSITGGLVYRGRQIPELQGAYLYADFVTGKVWALRYDPATKRVTSNREIPLPSAIPVMSFGEDGQGEVYFTTFSSDGRGIFRFK